MKCLIVIDMQNDFITGALGTKAAQRILPKIVEKVKNYDGYVYFTQDTHFAESYFETEEGKNLPILHCVKGTDGWKLPQNLYDVITRKYFDYVEKSSFGSEVLGLKLREIHFMEAYGIDEIELVGVCTNICVISNALLLKAYFPNIPIKVDASCCAGTSPDSHNNALKVMKDCQIEVTNHNHCSECTHCKFECKVSENCTPFDPYCSKGIQYNISPDTLVCDKFEKVIL